MTIVNSYKLSANWFCKIGFHIQTNKKIFEISQSDSNFM